MAGKQGGSKKKSRSSRQKGKYDAQRVRTTRNKHRRAIKQEKRQKFFAENPDAGSRSRRRRRAKYKARSNKRKKRKE